MNIESQAMKVNQKTGATQSSRFAQVALPTLLRLALLVGPLTVAVIFLAKSPLVCVAACVAILSMWLTVNVGPFRAGQRVKPAPAARKEQTSPRNLAKAQWWNALFFRLVILCAIYHSKLNF